MNYFLEIRSSKTETQERVTPRILATSCCDFPSFLNLFIKALSEVVRRGEALLTGVCPDGKGVGTETRNLSHRGDSVMLTSSFRNLNISEEGIK